jgi:hypothetical protein
MRTIFYTMHFRGQTSPTTTDPKVLRTTASATSAVLTTKIRASGIESNLQALDGQLAFMESELRLTSPNSFQGNGTISLGDESEHVLRFSVIEHGHFDPDIEPGTMTGTSSWKIEGGEGQFSGARGFITSAFTITSSGEYTDYQLGLLFFPN